MAVTGQRMGCFSALVTMRLLLFCLLPIGNKLLKQTIDSYFA